MATDDDALLAQLRALATQVDPVPDDVVLAGRSAFAYRDLDIRLAALVDDSALAGAGTRGDADAGRWLTFEVDDVVIELSVPSRPDERLSGQVDASSVASVHLVQESGRTPVQVDDLGRFSVSVEPGPLRLEVVLEDGRLIASSWVLAPRA